MPHEKALGLALQGEGRLRTVVVNGLMQYFQKQDVPILVRLLIIAFMFSAIAYSSLLTILILNLLHSAISGPSVPWTLYMSAFAFITCFLFGTFFLFGRQAVEYESYQRTDADFRQVTRARKRLGEPYAKK